MNKDQFFGLLRELFTAVGAGFVAWGVAHEGLWQEISGGMLSVGLIIWAIIYNEGREIIYTLVRKALSSLAGILVASGLLSPEKAEIVFGIVTSAVALVWSMTSKGPLPPAGGVTPLLLSGCFCLMLGGCAGVDGYDIKGEAVFLAEDGAKAGLRWEPGKPVAAFAKVAVRDPETGKVTGYSYVEIAPKARVVAEK